MFGVGNWTDTSQKYAITGVYSPANGHDYAAGTVAVAGATITNHLKLTITSVDSTAVKGSFSGDFYLNGDLSGTKSTITNGDFYVAWKK